MKFSLTISYKTIIPFIVSLALFMEALDTTIINTAIPAMSQSLQVDPVDLKIALISYLLSLAIFIPISGWVADKFGVKKVFLGALAIFTLSSFWCGYTNNLFELIVARSLQGLGGSHMMPVGRLILMRTFARHEMIDTMTRVVIISALGMMLGPVLGGFITHYISWRWIFWVNIPVGLLAILMAAYWLKDSEPQKMPPLDKLGFLLFGGSLAGFTFGLSAFSETTLSDKTASLVMLATSLLFIMYVLHSRQQAYPIVNTKLFQSRTFTISVVGNLLCRLGFGGVPFLVPLLLQITFGYSAQLSGLLLAPLALGVLMVKPFSFRLLRKLGYRNLLILNTVLVSVSLLTFSAITMGTSVYFIAFLTFIFGLLISLQFSGMNSLAYAQISSGNLSSATSILSTVQQLSQSFGVAVGALLLGYFSPAAAGQFVLSENVFHHTFLALGAITLLTVIIFVCLKKNDGDEMIKVPMAP